MKTVVMRTNTDNKLLSFLIKTNFGLFSMDHTPPDIKVEMQLCRIK